MKLSYLLMVSLAGLGSARAQDSSVDVPVLGYAFDASAGAIRPLRGIPGAALLGDPIDLGFSASSAVIAPQQSFALALSQDGQARVVALGAKTTVSGLDGAMTSPERMLFSPSGAAALLLAGNRAQIVTGLPGSPAVKDIDLSAIDGVIGRAALADDGTQLLLAETTRNTIWLFHMDGSYTMLPVSATGAVLAFRRGSHDAAAITRTGDLYQLQNLDDAPAVRAMLPASDATAEAVGLWISTDGAQAFAASTGGNITTVDLASGAARTVSCQCAPTGIQALRPGMYRLTDVSAKPVMVLDASAAAPQVWFVPVAGGVQ
jgi:hypothetical protein